MRDLRKTIAVKMLQKLPNSGPRVSFFAGNATRPGKTYTEPPARRNGDCGLDSFMFAGFRFPRFVSPYYTAPQPGVKHHFFYLDSEGSPARWKWADDCNDVRIYHKGWYCDNFHDQTIRGLVVLLTHGKFLAGWSMGEGMASEIELYLYDSERDAAYAADDMAKNAAERQREYEEEENARIHAEEVELERNLGGDAEETEGY